MNKEALAHWKCAKEDLLVAQHDLEISARSAASRAYYAAFHAVSALFALEEKTFSKHSAIESAVHRELVKTKRWFKELGAAYSKLCKLRTTSDYNVQENVNSEEAEAAIETARGILEVVLSEYQELEPDKHN